MSLFSVGTCISHPEGQVGSPARGQRRRRRFDKIFVDGIKFEHLVFLAPEVGCFVRF